MTDVDKLSSLLAHCRKYVGQDEKKLLAAIDAFAESPNSSDSNTLTSLLALCREHVETAGFDAEAKYDDIWNELYLDEGQYEVIEDTRHLLAEIDAAVEAH